ncbi:MAG: hypothetical protein LBW85_13150 [Deltaproteobacteria bacterium]|jgi:hypothetical protein|nr:hypothetical protein [Deltaproteobacteria bacterium]
MTRPPSFSLFPGRGSAFAAAALLLAFLAGCGSTPEDVERAGKALLDRALGSQNWSASEVRYDKSQDRLVYVGFKAVIADLTTLPDELKELAKSPVEARQLAITGLSKAGDLPKALAADSWKGGKAVRLADSVEIEGITFKSQPAENHAVSAGVERASIRDLALTDPLPDTGDGQAGYLRNLTAGSLSVTSVTVEGSEGDSGFQAALASFSASGLGFGGPLGSDGTLRGVLLSQTAQGFKGEKYSLTLDVDGQKGAAVFTLDEFTAKGVKGVGALDSAAVNGARLDMKTLRPGDPAFVMTLGSSSLEGMDSTEYLRRMITAVESYALTENPDAIAGLSTLADAFTLPYGLKGASMRDLAIKAVPGMELELRNVAFQGSEKAGELTPMMTEVQGFRLKFDSGEEVDPDLRKAAEAFSSLGLPEITGGMTMSVRPDPASRQLVYSIDSLKADGLGELSLRAVLDGIDQAAVDAMKAVPISTLDASALGVFLMSTPGLQALGLKELTLSYREESLFSRLLAGPWDIGPKLADSSDSATVALEYYAQLIGMSVNPDGAAALTGLIRNPGTFSVSYSPDVSLSAGSFMALQLASSPDLIKDLARFYVTAGDGQKLALFD